MTASTSGSRIVDLAFFSFMFFVLPFPHQQSTLHSSLGSGPPAYPTSNSLSSLSGVRLSETSRRDTLPIEPKQPPPHPLGNLISPIPNRSYNHISKNQPSHIKPHPSSQEQNPVSKPNIKSQHLLPKNASNSESTDQSYITPPQLLQPPRQTPFKPHVYPVFEENQTGVGSDDQTLMNG